MSTQKIPTRAVDGLGTAAFVNTEAFVSPSHLTTNYYDKTEIDNSLGNKVDATRNVNTGTGLGGGGNLSADRTIAIDKASDSEVRSRASNKVLTTDLLESAAAPVALTDAATVAVSWTGAYYYTLTLTANRVLGNPTGGVPGTWITIRVQGNNTTDRTLTFGNQYLNELPTLTDIDSGQPYLLTIFCHSSTEFYVFAAKAGSW